MSAGLRIFRVLSALISLLRRCRRGARPAAGAHSGCQAQPKSIWQPASTWVQFWREAKKSAVESRPYCVSRSQGLVQRAILRHGRAACVPHGTGQQHLPAAGAVELHRFHGILGAVAGIAVQVGQLYRRITSALPSAGFTATRWLLPSCGAVHLHQQAGRPAPPPARRHPAAGQLLRPLHRRLGHLPVGGHRADRAAVGFQLPEGSRPRQADSQPMSPAALWPPGQHPFAAAVQLPAQAPAW